MTLEVVAIDGPAGSGKSSVARRVAAALGYRYLDTGAMYRAVTLHFLRLGLTENYDLLGEEQLAKALDDLELECREGGQVFLAGQDVSSELRSREVEARVSPVSALPAVRQKMRAMQRALAEAGPLVAEGRDMASVVFPGARCQFYLDATAKERARRRQRDFGEQGREVSEAQVLEEIRDRDMLDSSRAEAPLTRAPGAIYVDSSELCLEEVVGLIVELVEAGGHNSR